MKKQTNPKQIQIRMEKLQKEINDTRYFIIHALCKETKEIYEQTLFEKEQELKQLIEKNQKTDI